MANRFNILTKEAELAEKEAERSLLSRFVENIPGEFMKIREKIGDIPGWKQIREAITPEPEEAKKFGLVPSGLEGVYIDPMGAVGALKKVGPIAAKIVGAERVAMEAEALAKRSIQKADSALSKLISAIKQAGPARKELEELASKERRKRVGAVAGILEKGEGEKAFIQAKGVLKGELVPKKPAFEPLRAPIKPDLTKVAPTTVLKGVISQAKEQGYKITDISSTPLGKEKGFIYRIEKGKDKMYAKSEAEIADLIKTSREKEIIPPSKLKVEEVKYEGGWKRVIADKETGKPLVNIGTSSAWEKDIMKNGLDKSLVHYPENLAKPIFPDLQPLAQEARKFQGKTFEYVKNLAKTGKPKTGFGQEIEPMGKYINLAPAENVKGLPNYETGKITFKNPLVVEWKTTQVGGWKSDLSNIYDGKTGKELSEAIARDGYDAIITIDKGNPLEVVDLSAFAKVKVISKELEPLAVEARKYKSAEEFVEVQQKELREIASETLENIRVSGFEHTINPDKTLTLYHKTTPLAASNIERTGKFSAGSFFADSLESARELAAIKKGGEKIIEIKVDPADVFFNQGTFEFEAEIALRRGRDGIFRSVERKTPQELTNFYNQAVKGAGEVTPEVGEKLLQGDIDELFIQIQRHPTLSPFEKISAADGFSQLLNGQIPQQSKLSLMEDIFGSDLIKEVIAKRGNLEKFKDAITEVLNIPRSFMASFDMSAPLRQGIIFTTTKPKSAMKAGWEMFRQTFSEKNYVQWLDDIKTDSLYQTIKDSGLYIADPRRVSGGLAAREERFMSNLAEKIPIVGIGIRAAERAYTSYLNKLRVDVFANTALKFKKMGLIPEKEPILYKSLADWINNTTGRGDLGKLGRISQQLNTLFFSPRLIASRFNMLNPVWYAKQAPQVRKEAIKSFAEFVGIGVGILSLAKFAGADVEVDPRSTDFGKIRIGNTRWDIWGGFQQWARVISQIISGERKTQKGDIIELSRKKFPFETRFDVAERFFRGKLAPIPSLALELFEGSKMYGEELKATTEFTENLTPLYLQDIKESFSQLGPSAMITVGVPAFFGVGVQTYEEKKKKGRFNF